MTATKLKQYFNIVSAWHMMVIQIHYCGYRLTPEGGSYTNAYFAAVEEQTCGSTALV